MSKFLIVLKDLEKWFFHQQRVLPWRNNPDVYRVWVSEIMLQQTQVVAVIPFFDRFMQRFPTVESLAEATEDEVLLYWSGLGYYSRARNLHRSGQKIVKQGKFPQTREEWLEMPGVGNYTAGAILSIALDQPEAILDGNIERVFSRLRHISRQRGDVEFKSRLWRLSRKFVEAGFKIKIRPSILNQALMELGATICTPRNPQCMRCPISSYCRSYKAGDQDKYPPKKKPKEWIHVEETLQCVLNNSGRVLLRKREVGEWRHGLWDLLEEKPELGSDAGIKCLGEVETRHIVTRHKIRRVTQIWVLAGNRSKKNGSAAEKWGAAEGWGAEVGLRWVSIENPEVAIGSALKRTLGAVTKLFLTREA